MLVFAVNSKGDTETKIADGIHQAYTVAAGMRTFLVGQSLTPVRGVRPRFSTFINGRVILNFVIHIGVRPLFSAL